MSKEYRPQGPTQIILSALREGIFSNNKVNEERKEAITSIVKDAAALIQWKPGPLEIFKTHRVINKIINNARKSGEEPDLSDIANMALLGVMNVAIAGGHRPVVQAFQGNYNGYIDLNQGGNTPEASSNIDQNRTTTLLDDSEVLFIQARFRALVSPLQPGEKLEAIISKVDPNGTLQTAMPPGSTTKLSNEIDNPQIENDISYSLRMSI